MKNASSTQTRRLILAAIDLEQSDDLSGRKIQIHIIKHGAGGESRHGPHLTKQWIQESRADGGADVADEHTEAARRAFESRLGAEGEMGLCHTQVKVRKAKFCELLDLGFRFGGIVHAVSAIDFTADGLDLDLNWLIQRIEELKVARLSCRLDNCLCQ